MLKKIINFILNLFRKKNYNDALSGYVAPSGAVSGSPKPKPVERKVYEMPCGYCHEGMPIVNGQVAYAHKACRTKYRAQLRRRHA